MAKFNSYLLGKVRKSVGNITTCIFNKENIAKAKIFSRKDVKTPEILAQRAKMKAIVSIARKLLPVIRKGFVGVGRGTTSNAFTSLNMSRIEVDEKYSATVDFERLRFRPPLHAESQRQLRRVDQNVFLHSRDAGRRR